MTMASKNDRNRNWRFIVPCSILVLLFFISFQPMASGGQSAPTKLILKYSEQWSQSNHSHNETANETNTDAIKNPEDAACLVCHDTRGFIAWSTKSFDPGFKTPEIHKAGGASGPSCRACR